MVLPNVTTNDGLFALRVFDVEHGASALLVAPNRASLLIDCGHNSTTGFRPSQLARLGFDASVNRLTGLVVSNFDEDHLSDFPQTLDALNPKVIYRNPSVTTRALLEMKRESGLGPGVASCATALAVQYTEPAPLTDLGGAEMQMFWANYPWVTDTNNLSLVTFLAFGTAGILFPGDLGPQGWRLLLARDDFRRVLQRTNVFVAPHHGRDSGYLSEIFRFCRPQVVVISDKGVVHDSQATDYGRCATGIVFGDGNSRNCISTRNNGDITIFGTLLGQSSIHLEKR